MKLFNTLLTLLTLTLPSHAASPKTCRIAAASRVNRLQIISTAHTIPHHTHQPQFVVTAFAVPVAVPVAPFAPYWYGISDYHVGHAPPDNPPVSYAPPEIQQHDRQGRVSQPARPLITQRCASCHGRTSPKQGLSLVDPVSLSDHDRLRAVRAVINGEMPPDTENPLTDGDRAALVAELLNATPTTESENDK